MSSEGSKPDSTCRAARNTFNGHPGSVSKNEVRQSASNCLDGPIQEGDNGNMGHCSTISESRTVFVNNWVIPYGMQIYLLRNNGLQLISKFFADETACLGIKPLTTTAYQPDTSVQVEIFNGTIVAGLSHYDAQHQFNWDKRV